MNAVVVMSYSGSQVIYNGYDVVKSVYFELSTGCCIICQGIAIISTIE